MHKVHKRFFRFMMAQKICAKETALNTWQEISMNENENAVEQFSTCLETINSNIKQFDMEVVEGRSEVTGLDSVALVQVCTSLLPVGIRKVFESKAVDKKLSYFFAKLISAIVVSEHNKITETEAANIGVYAEIARSSIQPTLDRLADEEWLELHAGYVYLGVLSLLELGQLIAATYPQNIFPCPLCLRNVFHGTLCRKCHKKTHNLCLQKYFNMNNNKNCPHCQGILSDSNVATPGASTSFGTPGSPDAHSGPTPPKRLKLRKRMS